MPLQYLQNDTGQTTAVVIPIDEWRHITSKHQDLKELEQSLTLEPAERLKPSDFAGALSEEGYQAINKHIQQVRNDWDRNTF